MSPNLTYADRLGSLAITLGYRAPVAMAPHAVARLWERWGLRWVHIDKATIVEIDGRNNATIWIVKHYLGDVKLVVAPDGMVKTVLPPGAEKRVYRPVKGKKRR